jgi:hypothetical protein
MPEPTFQTVHLARGRHKSPDQGACVMELASMIAGERFTDHPRSVCPAIASFLRAYNDLVPSSSRDELYPYAARVVGSRGSRRTARRRARLLMSWGDRDGEMRRPAWARRFETLTWTGSVAAHHALRLPPGDRDAEVRRILEELLAIGAEPGAGGVRLTDVAVEQELVTRSREPLAG